MKERLVAYISRVTSKKGLQKIWYGEKSSDLDLKRGSTQSLERIGVTAAGMAVILSVLWNNIEADWAVKMLIRLGEEVPLVIPLAQQIEKFGRRFEEEVRAREGEDKLRALRAQLEEERRLGF